METNYGSIMRCEDIDDNELLTFDGREKIWRDIKNQFVDWDFSADTSRDQKSMFECLWRNAGEQICSEI